MQDMKHYEKTLQHIGTFIGRILVCRLTDGNTFAAKLIEVNPSGLLLWENSKGEIISDNIADIASFEVYKKISNLPKQSKEISKSSISNSQ
jgi:hypothetical protein